MAKENSSLPDNDDPDELERLFQEVMECKPAISESDVGQLADRFISNEYVGRPVRCGLVLASKDGAFFKNMAEDKATAALFAEVVGSMQDCAKSLRVYAELIDCAATRTTVALCNHEEYDPGTGSWKGA
ncbi:MAG: hypothetical protein V4864_16125 [Pseudomonadota bacterium]